MYDNYEDACEAVLTKARVLKFVGEHGGTDPSLFVQQFVNEIGDHEYYLGKVVLDWLGY